MLSCILTLSGLYTRKYIPNKQTRILILQDMIMVVLLYPDISNFTFWNIKNLKCKNFLIDFGSVGLLWWNAKCKFAKKHLSKKLSPGFTLHFAFRQSKATDQFLMN